ncbi:MAG: GAF domain-containing protein, partial [Gammaproteobacteria bacterium]|nr:GAF domain-containing protein [Gammaproteobacteria bacterium]
MRIRSKLLINGVFMILCLFAVGSIGYFYVHNVTRLSMLLVDEQAIPILKLNDLEKPAWEIWSRLIAHTGTADRKTMQQIEQEITRFKQEIHEQMRDIEETHHHEHVSEKAAPGDISNSDELQIFRENWLLFYKVVQQVLLFSQDVGKKEEARQLIIGEGQRFFNAALSSLRMQEDRHHQSLEALRKDVQSEQEQAVFVIIGITLLVGVIMSGLLIAVGRSIVRPLAVALDTARQIAAGNLTVRTRVRNAKDETSQLLVAMNDMAAKLQSNIQEAGSVLSKFSQGDMRSRITTDFLGDFAEIKGAANEMADRLQGVIGETSEMLGQLFNGGMQARISSEFSGDFAEIKRAANETAAKLQGVISETSGAFGQLAKGNMSARISGEFPGDFAEIKQAANGMVKNIQGIISETGKTLKQLSGGDMEVHISREFAGDFMEVKNALEMTAAQLTEATAKNTTETWLKNGQTQLNERVSGEQQMKQLAENVINFLAPYVQAQVGAIYLLEENADQTPRLRMIASHAYMWRKNGVNTFALGEGIVGQAGFEQKMFIITKAPRDYIHIRSGLGQAKPAVILVMPFLYENTLKGVIELASFERFTQIQLEFLEQSMSAVAIAVNTAQSRAGMQNLLEESRAQSKALQIQQEKTQQANEEMQIQQEKLRVANEQMQSQSEELQAQQEELRQTNE